MLENIDIAIAKINEEMQKNADDPYTEVIGHYIIDRCESEITAEKVAAEDKTLAGAMKAILQKASAVKKGSVAVLLPEIVFGEVDRYFGLPTDLSAQQAAFRPSASLGLPEYRKPEQIVLDLESFL